MICQSQVQNAGCVFALFCARHKNNFQLQFRSFFKYLLFECSLKKGNILNLPYPQVRKCSSHFSC